MVGNDVGEDTQALHVQLLGPLRVSLRGQDVTPRQERLRSLLGMLLSAGPAGLSRQVLLQAAWSADQHERDPAPALHIAVSRLRSWAAGTGQGGLAVIREPAGYRVHPLRCVLDASEFTDLVAESERDDCPADRRLRLLETATLLWRGPLLAGLPDPVREAAGAEAWHKRRIAAVLALAEAARSTGQPDRGLAHLEELAESHPFDERLQAGLIQSLADSGRPAQALVAYGRIRDLLANELGVDPAPELREAYLRVLRDERSGPPAALRDGPVEPATRTPTTTTTPATAEPATTVPAGVRPALPEPVTTPVVPEQLPIGAGHVVGRDELIARVADLLTAGSDDGPEATGRTALPVIALTGPAGAGKTTVAVEVARRIADRFPDGRLFVDLHGVRPQPAEPAEALGRLLRALGVADDAIPAEPDERAALLRSRTAGRRLLLVLDNIANEAQVRPLLPAGTGCAVLITSRRIPAALPGVQLVDLGMLDRRDALALLARFCGPARVASERAEADRIVEYCARLPLAIHIAGARLASRPQWRLDRLARLLADERRRLDELTVGDLAVRASIGLSVAALDPPQRRLFGLLSLLDVPDFPVWAAAAMLGVPVAEAEALLEELVDVCLVTSVGEDVTGEFRYRMHDLVRLVAREFASEREDPVARRSAIGRAAQEWLRRAWLARRWFPGPPLPQGHRPVEDEEPAGRRFPGPPLPPGHRPVDEDAGLDDESRAPAPELIRAARDWFEAERAAMSTMVVQSAAEDLPELAWRLAASLSGFFYLCGYWDDWERTTEAALRVARGAGDDLGVAMSLWGHAELMIARDRFDEAADALAEAETYFAARDDPSTRASVLVRIGYLHHVRGDMARCRDTHESALRLLTGPETDLIRSYVLRYLGMLHRDLGARQEAREHLARALVAARRSGDLYGEALTLETLGKAYGNWGEPATGRGYLVRAAQRYESIGDRIGVLHTQLNIGETMLTLDDPGAARELLRECLAELRWRGDLFGEASALSTLGLAELQCGDPVAARQSLEMSLAYWREAGVPLLQARALDRLAMVHRTLGDIPAARRYWLAALDIYRQLDFPQQARIAGSLAALDDEATAARTRESFRKEAG
ncbi:BTAD domain-containing putative transcriptional regulator [Plantactinospora solaniradicis]|uniref:BTAD domain-containing putative transcriptional regulator n=1 Tax=Plantactinospora solaniradicis TaxID=1723736 RepID=A0ABW1KNL9_9ACTN